MKGRLVSSKSGERVSESERELLRGIGGNSNIPRSHSPRPTFAVNIVVSSTWDHISNGNQILVENHRSGSPKGETWDPEFRRYGGESVGAGANDRYVTVHRNWPTASSCGTRNDSTFIFFHEWLNLPPSSKLLRSTDRPEPVAELGREPARTERLYA